MRFFVAFLSCVAVTEEWNGSSCSGAFSDFTGSHMSCWRNFCLWWRLLTNASVAKEPGKLRMQQE